MDAFPPARKGSVLWFVALAVLVVVLVVVIVIFVSSGKATNESTLPASPTSPASPPTSAPPASPSTPGPPASPPTPAPPPPAAAVGKTIVHANVKIRSEGEFALAEMAMYGANNQKLATTADVRLAMSETDPSFLIDGNLDTVARTTADYNPQELGFKRFTISLAQPTQVHKVVIENRRDCCKDQIVGSLVEVRNSVDILDSCPVIEIQQARDTYELDLTKTPCELRSGGEIVGRAI